MELENITFKEKPVENKGSSRNLKDNFCPECKKPMKRYLISHDLYKMYTIVACPKHPYVIWEDVFKKVDDISVSQDWTNMDERFEKPWKD
jgi:hypothetical protein